MTSLAESKEFSVWSLTAEEIRSISRTVVDRAKCPPSMRDEALGVAAEMLLKAEDIYDPEKSSVRMSKRGFVIWKATLLLIDWQREWHGYKAKRSKGWAHHELVISDGSVFDEEENSWVPSTTDDEIIEQLDDAAFLADVVEATAAKLNDKERYVLYQVVLSGRYMSVVGDEIGVTESRVCQITRVVENSLRFHANLFMKEPVQNVSVIRPVGKIEMMEPKPKPEPSYVDLLTSREQEVLQLFVDGLTVPEAAEEMGIGHKTAKNHFGSIYKKFGVNDRAQAVLFALRKGIVEL